MTPEVDLESAAYVLYVARREVDSIPYTAPEALVDRLRQVVPLGQELLDEIRRLREAAESRAAQMTKAGPSPWRAPKRGGYQSKGAGPAPTRAPRGPAGTSEVRP